MPFLRQLAAVCLASVICVRLAAADTSAAPRGEPPIIAKARAYLGSEAALENITSIHYVGTLITTDPTDPSKHSRARLELIFQKPDRQRIMATSDKNVEVTALDGYDGWHRIQDANDATKWQQTLLGSDQIKRLRANTWENTAFLRGIERVGGRVEDQGTATKDGVTCQKIAFIHAPNIIFYKYIDAATGRVVLTENEAGGTVREEGEIVVNGVRFPKTVTQVVPGQNTIVLSYDKITLNETLPASLFQIPPMR